jgi:copper(I)-binding protein
VTLGASAQETRHKPVSIVHRFVVETEQSQAVLQARIKNRGDVTERLLRASIPLAAKVSMIDAAGKNLKELTIPGGGELTLKSDGARILLTGLAKPLSAYDSFDLTLVFQKAGAVTVEVVVEEKTSDERE